jgi:DNA polymerase delta subunit 1
MKKDELVAECKRLGLDESGTLVILRGRLKESRMKKQQSVEDLFKNYEQSTSKNEPL